MPASNDRCSFSLSLPAESPYETISLLKLAESCGYSGVWIPDSPLLWREPFTSLAFYAGATTRIGLGIAVTNVITRHPSVIASAALTLNELSGGRFTLGIGSGATGVGTAGLHKASLSRLEAEVGRIRELLSGRDSAVDFSAAQHHTLSSSLSGGKNEYVPKGEMRIRWKANLPAPPNFLSAHGPRSLRLAGKISDGVIFSLGAMPEMVRFANEEVSRGAIDAGRDPVQVQRWCRVALAIGEENRAQLLEEVRPYVATVETNLAFLGYSSKAESWVPAFLKDEVLKTLKEYDIGEHVQKGAAHAHSVSDDAVKQLAVTGSVDECLRRLETLKEAGATNFNLVIFTAGDKPTVIRRFAENVMARLA